MFLWRFLRLLGLKDIMQSELKSYYCSVTKTSIVIHIGQAICRHMFHTQTEIKSCVAPHYSEFLFLVTISSKSVAIIMRMLHRHWEAPPVWTKLWPHTTAAHSSLRLSRFHHITSFLLHYQLSKCQFHGKIEYIHFYKFTVNVNLRNSECKKIRNNHVLPFGVLNVNCIKICIIKGRPTKSGIDIRRDSKLIYRFLLHSLSHTHTWTVNTDMNKAHRESRWCFMLGQAGFAIENDVQCK